MKRLAAWLIILTASVAGLMASCTIVQRYGQLKPGEIRLLKLNAPEIVKEDLSYEGSIRFRSDEAPTVRRVCCRWIAENPTVKNSSMYWYNYEVASNKEIGSAGTRWLDEGPISDFSDPFCVDSNKIKVLGTDTLVFQFKVTGLKRTYNRLECYAETMVEGVFKESNRVSAPVNRTSK